MNLKNENSGRSMIEMLGVLAIIAVLSVGGIEGFGKAMQKFKLNKVAEEYNYLILGLLEQENSLQKIDSPSQTGLAGFVLAAGLVPETWKKKGDIWITDSIGNQTKLFIRGNSENRNLVISVYPDVVYAADKSMLDGTATEFCEELMHGVIVPLHSVLYYVWIYRGGSLSAGAIYYGDAYCQKKSCIRTMTLENIHNACRQCSQDDVCAIALEFKMN